VNGERLALTEKTGSEVFLARTAHQVCLEKREIGEISDHAACKALLELLDPQ
jgi:hypothetical protein